MNARAIFQKTCLITDFVIHQRYRGARQLSEDLA